MGKVLQRAGNPDSEVEGYYDDNPTLNSHLYEVEFTDGSVREYSANIIAKNMLTQVDEDGYSLTMMNAIINHEVDPAVAVSKEDGFVISKRGNKMLRKTTAGWRLLVQWKDKLES